MEFQILSTLFTLEGILRSVFYTSQAEIPEEEKTQIVKLNWYNKSRRILLSPSISFSLLSIQHEKFEKNSIKQSSLREETL